MPYRHSDGTLDWPKISAQLVEASSIILTRWLTESTSPLYAAAFFGSYREYDAAICLPFFAANSRDGVPAGCSNRFYDSVRWTPEDWPLYEEFDTAPLQALQKALDIASAGPTQWPMIETQFVDCIIHSTRILHQRFAHHPNVSADFVVFFDDEDGGIDTARASLPSSLHNCFLP